MRKTLLKAIWLLLIPWYLFLMFLASQAHHWVWTAVWAVVICVLANNYSDLEWKNVSVITTVNGVTATQRFWTHKGARKAFDAAVAVYTQYARDNNIPITEHKIEEGH